MDNVIRNCLNRLLKAERQADLTDLFTVPKINLEILPTCLIELQCTKSPKLGALRRMSLLFITIYNLINTSNYSNYLKTFFDSGIMFKLCFLIQVFAEQKQCVGSQVLPASQYFNL